MTRYIFGVFFTLACLSLSYSQSLKDTTTTVYLASFKNDAAGAYSLIHDDFGADWASGIEQYADTMTYRRGIPFSFAVITNQCNASDWKKAKELIAHGHQVVNHSMSHICGQPLEWCQAGNWDEKDFGLEIDKSTALIQRNTGYHPAFFIFPYDLFTDTMVAYLRYKNYAGARAGDQDKLQSAHIKDPFRLNFKVFRPEQSAADLNAFANEAVQKKGWAIRVTHGVQDESWGKISLTDYAGHLDHIKGLSDKNNLWIANLSDITLYSYLLEMYNVSISEKDQQGRTTRIEFKFIGEGKSNSSFYKQSFATAKLRNLTIVVLQGDLKVAKIIQKGKAIPFKIMNEKLLIDADPSKGDLFLYY